MDIAVSSINIRRVPEGVRVTLDGEAETLTTGEARVLGLALMEAADE